MQRTRVITYKSIKPCSVCHKLVPLTRTDTPNPMHFVYGPGDDDYGRNPIPPPAIPPPERIRTKVTCANCLSEIANEEIFDLEVISDSEQERYDDLVRLRDHKSRKEHFKKFLDADSTDSE